jgi:hypothetical protein
MTRLRLKHASGWFAAGQEVMLSLEILSAEAFRLYVCLCLYAERQTGRIAWNADEVAPLLHSGTEELRKAMAELCRKDVCVPVGGAEVEICDRFWPYEKLAIAQSVTEQASYYIEQVRRILLRPACVRASFSAADQRLAANFYRSGVTLNQLERAIWLGCARKYIALLNNQSAMLITSLHYFTGLVEEVSATSVADSYWLHVQRKVEQLERRWMANRSATTPAQKDEMMETK